MVQSSIHISDKFRYQTSAGECSKFGLQDMSGFQTCLDFKLPNGPVCPKPSSLEFGFWCSDLGP